MGSLPESRWRIICQRRAQCYLFYLLNFYFFQTEEILLMITKEKIRKGRWRHFQNNKDNTPEYPAPKPSPYRFCINKSYKDGKKPVKLMLKVKLRQPSTTSRGDRNYLNEYYTVSFEKTAREEARNQSPSFLAYVRFAEKKQNKTKGWIWKGLVAPIYEGKTLMRKNSLLKGCLQFSEKAKLPKFRCESSRAVSQQHYLSLFSSPRRISHPSSQVTV